MKRRDAIKGIVLFSLGTSIIYSCTDKFQAVHELALKQLDFTNDELDIIDAVSRSTVPLQSIPQLAEHSALPFVLTMVDDLYPKEDIDLFIAGVRSIDSRTIVEFGKPFLRLDDTDSMTFLRSLNIAEVGTPVPIQRMFDMIKSESIKYLRTTEHIQRTVNYYEMAPGRYSGDIAISALKNANQI